MGLMSVALSAQIQACVSAPHLPADFPEDAHLSTDVLGHSLQILVLIVVASC